MSNYITLTGITSDEDIYIKKSSIAVVQLGHFTPTLRSKIKGSFLGEIVPDKVCTSIIVNDYVSYYVKESMAEVIRKLR